MAAKRRRKRAQQAASYRGNGTARKSPERKALQEAFLRALEHQGTVGAACKQAGVASRTTIYRWRQEEPEFAEVMDEVYEQATDDLIASNFVRARDGWLEPVWHKGEECGQVRKFDHTLAIYFMKHRRPESMMERVVAERVLARLMAEADQQVDDGEEPPLQYL